jgi:anti-sigma regulatory factor (Ser/Thr protein kinase)
MPEARVELDQVPQTPPHVEMRLLSQPRYLCGARDAVSSIARRFGFDEQTSGQLALAVDEALCNIIRHGYNDAPDKPVWLRIWPLIETECVGTPGGIRIILEDEAKQVDPEKIKSRDLAEIRPGGLGVHIIKQIMTAARFEKREGPQGGMRLIMSKKLEPKPDTTSSTTSSPPTASTSERQPALVKGKG